MDEPAVQTELDSDARIGEDDETLELFSVLCHRDDVILVASAFGWQCKRCKINFDFSSGKSMENHLNAAHNIVTSAEQTPKVPPSSPVKEKPILITRREGIPQKTPSSLSVKEKLVTVTGRKNILQNTASSSSVTEKPIVVVTKREVTPQSSNPNMSAGMDGTAVDSSAAFGWSRKRTFKAMELEGRDSVTHKKSKSSCDKAEETKLTVSDTDTNQTTSIVRPLTQDEKLINITLSDQESEGKGTSGVQISEADMKLVSASSMTPVVVLPKVNMKPACTIRKRNTSFSSEETLNSKTEQIFSSAVKKNQIKVICRPQNKETVQSLCQKEHGFSSKMNKIIMLPPQTAKQSPRRRSRSNQSSQRIWNYYLSDNDADVSPLIDKYVAEQDYETKDLSTVSESAPTDYEKMEQNTSVQSEVRAEGAFVESDIAQAAHKKVENISRPSEIVQISVDLTDASSQLNVHHQTLPNVDKTEQLQISGNTTAAVAFSEHDWAAENLSHIENATGDGALVAPAEWEVKVDCSSQSNNEMSSGTEETYVPVSVTDEKQVTVSIKEENHSPGSAVGKVHDGAMVAAVAGEHSDTMCDTIVQNVQDPKLSLDFVSSSHGIEKRVDVEPLFSSSATNERSQSDKCTLSGYDSSLPAFRQIKDCSFCHHPFSNSESLLKHTRHYQNQKPVQCKVCQRKFHNLDILNIHIFYDHEKDSTPQCLTCHKKYHSKVSLAEHMVKKHSASKGLTRTKLHFDSLAVEKCTVCNINIRSLPELVSLHYRAHGRKDFSCKVCGKWFKRQFLMHTHFQLEHSKDDRGKRLFSDIDEETKSLIKDLLDEESESHIGKLASGTEPQRSYFCSVCQKDVTATRRAFMKHLMSHYGTKASREVEMHPDKPYECPDCGEEVPYVGDMVNYHRLTHGHVDNENVKLKCTFCSAYFVNEGTRKRHERDIHWDNSHAKKKTFMCEICAKVFMRTRSLEIHQKMHNEKEGNFTCDICYMGFRYKSKMETHRAKHGTKEGTTLCPHCGKEYMSKHSLDRHVKADHLGVKDYKYKCDLCPKQYYIARHLRDHVATKHEGKRPYACKMCDATFLCNTTLKRHIRRDHVEHNPLVCSVCQESFTDKHLLTRHESVAHKGGVEPFACQFCQKAFSRPSSLKNHMNMHRGIRPFLCEDCGMGFVANNQLQRHLRTHCKASRPRQYKVPLIESTALVADSQG